MYLIWCGSSFFCLFALYAVDCAVIYNVIIARIVVVKSRLNFTHIPLQFQLHYVLMRVRARSEGPN